MTSYLNRTFTRIPPASTGPRVSLTPHAIVTYDNRTGTFVPDSDIMFDTSGIMAHVNAVFPLTSTTGLLSVHYDDNSIVNNTVPIAGEDIVFNGSTIATVSTTVAAYDMYTNNAVIIGKNNSEYGLNVDQFGAATVRFTEGAAQLDAFGKLRTSNATLLGDYTFAAGLLREAFSSTEIGGGTVTWNSTERAAVLTTDSVSGSRAIHTSNTYHHYFPGSSHTFIGTFALESGVTNLTRHWGLFDEFNGFMFSEINGVLGVTIRSSATGTTTDTFISQSQWNKDKADGTGASTMTINTSYDNIYWMDVQWLGGGRCRFGTYYNGTRVVLHEYYHGNSSPYPISQTASLPVCIFQQNTGNTGFSKSIKSWCIAVWSESQLDVDATAAPDVDTLGKTVTGSAAAQSLHYLGTLTPSELLPTGDVNHSVYFPISLDIIAYDTVTGTQQVGELYIYIEPVLSGASFSPIAIASTVDIDQNATSFGGGRKILETYFRGEKVVDLSKIFDSLSRGTFKNYADNGGTRTVAIQNVTQASPAVLTVSSASIQQHVHREGNILTITGVSGMTEINNLQVYPKLTGLFTMELYTDAGLTTPLDTSGFSAYTSGGSLKGYFGSRAFFSLFYKKLLPNTNDIQVNATVSWKEIVQ